ncbi:MAG: TonB-dependent receptor [Pseudomonadota bacterium]
MKTTSNLLLRGTLAFAFGSVSVFANAQDSEELIADEIIVRGDKISRTAAEVAPSTSIITEDEIERPATQTINSVVQGQPNVIADEDGTIPTIRGISSSVNNNQIFGSGVLPRVPVLIDNVATPVGQSAGYLSNTAWDVGTVEVARGPQPTSTGRNAFSGAIRVYTNDPIFEPEYALRLGASDFRDGRNAAFVVNQPLLEDQLALRIAGSYRQGDTLVRVTDPNVIIDVNELEYRNLRAKARFTPVAIPGLDLKFTFDYQSTDDQFAPVVDIGNEPDQFFSNNFIGFGGYDETERMHYIFDANYEFSEGNTLFFRSSLTDSLLSNPFIGSLGVAGFREFGELNFENDEIEVETYFQFADIGPISKGVIGVIYNGTTETLDTDPLGLTNAFLIDVDGDYTNRAIYGEIEWDLGSVIGLDGLTLLTGGRYEMDERERAVFADNNLQARRVFKENIFLPKVGLRYEPTNTLQLGYTYSEGFRPGGLEVDLVSGFVFPIGAPGFLGISPFEKETIQNHEIFVKASLLDDQLSLGASAFYYKYEDAQVAGASAVPSAFPGFFLTGNIPEAIGQGIELTAEYQSEFGLGVSANLGYLDTEITDAGPVATAFQGSELPNAPNITASLGVSYEHSLGWDASVNVRHVGEMFNRLGVPRIDPYTVVDLAAGYEFTVLDDFDTRIDLSVNNVLDKAYVLENADGRDIVGRPREFWLSLTTRF